MAEGLSRPVWGRRTGPDSAVLAVSPRGILPFGSYSVYGTTGLTAALLSRSRLMKNSVNSEARPSPYNRITNRFAYSYPSEYRVHPRATPTSPVVARAS